MQASRDHYGIGEFVFQANRIPPARTAKTRNPFREHDKPQSVIVRLSASVILWAFTKRTEKISQQLLEWRDLYLWRKLSAARRNTMQISRHPGAVSLQKTPTFRIILSQPSDSLVLDFGQDQAAAQKWHDALRLMSLPWRTLVDQSSKHVIKDLQTTGLIKAIKFSQQQPASASEQHQPMSQAVSADAAQGLNDVIHGVHDQLVLVNEQVQSSAELVEGVLEALEITLPVFEQICGKLPLVGVAVQLTCLGLSTISKVVATQIQARLVNDVRRRVNRIASLVMVEMLRADYTAYEASEEYLHGLEDVMAGLETAHASLDSYVISGVLHRTWSGPIPAEIMTCLDAVEMNLRSLRILHTTLDTAEEVRRIQQHVQHHLRISSNDAKGSVPPNSYVPNFQMSRRVDLGRMPILPEASTTLNTLKEAVLNGRTASLILHLQGEGGVGKSTTCCLLIADKSVQEEFYDGSIWIQLGRQASEADAISELSRSVRNLGGSGIAEDVEHLSAKRGGLEEAIELVAHFLSGRHLLLILDNVWLRAPQERSWLSLFSQLLSARSPNSAILVTSREMSVCKGFSVQTISVPRLDVTDENGISEPAKRLFDYNYVRSLGESCPNEDQDDYVQGRKELLKLTCGVHLLIAMVATYAATREKKRGEALNSVRLRLSDRILRMESQGLHESPNMAAIISECLEHIEEVAADDPLGFLDNIQNRQGAGCFSRFYESLCVAPPIRPAIAISVLEYKWNLTREETDAVAEMFESASLARIEANDTGGGIGVELVLHDLQMKFCEEAALQSGRFSTHHETLLRRFREKSGWDIGSSAAEYDWSMDCFPGSNTSRSKQERGHYLSRQLVRHMVGASGESDGEAGKTRLLQLLTDFRWISQRGSHFGRSSLMKDLATAAPHLFNPAAVTSGHPGTTDIRNCVKWTTSETQFLECIRRILLSIPPAVYESAKNEGTGSLATALYGRIKSSSEWNATSQHNAGVSDDGDSLEAVQRFSIFAEKVSRHTNCTWLRPLNTFFTAAQKVDDRLLQELAASDSHIRGVVSLSSGRHFVTGSGDGVIGIHDIISGETTAAFRVHTDSVLDLRSSSKESDMFGEEIISCSLDGTIRLWHVEDKYRPTLRPEQCLTVEHENGDRYSFCRGDISEDGNIIVGAIRERKKIHMWKRSDRNGKHQYRGPLPGEYAPILSSLSLSGSGTSVVCSSFCAPHITEWKAATSEPDQESWRRETYTLNVPKFWNETRVVKAQTLSVSANLASTVLWVGTREGLLVSPSFERENERSWFPAIPCMRKGVNSISLISEGTEWHTCEVLLGHHDGTVTRHLPPLNGRTDVSYGTASSFGSNAVFSLAIARPRSEGGETSTFVSGHADGILRVWRMEEGMNSVQGANLFGGTGTNPGPSPEQGVSDAIACISASLDERLIVSGSKRGSLCLWDASLGVPLNSTFLPPTTSRRTGRMTFCCIQTVDVCSIDGNVLIACGAADWSLRVWDLSGNIIQKVILPQVHSNDEENMIGVTRYGVEVGFAVTLFSSDANSIGVLTTDGDVRIYKVWRSIEDGIVHLQLLYAAHEHLREEPLQAELAFHGRRKFCSLAISPSGEKYILVDGEGEGLLVDTQNVSSTIRGRVDVSKDREIQSCLAAFAPHVEAAGWRERALTETFVGSQLERSVLSSSGTRLAVRCVVDRSLARRWVEVQYMRDSTPQPPTRVTFEVELTEMAFILPPGGRNAAEVVLVCGLGNGRVAFLALENPP